MIVFQDSQGLIFYPPDQIAAFTPTFPNRWRVVAADGTVGYRPDLPPGRWLPLGPSHVVPQRLTPEGTDPAGWNHGPHNLPSIPFEPVADLDVWAWSKGQWLTDAGLVPADLPVEVVLRNHPDMRLARRDFCFNRRRLRRLLRAPGSDVLMLFDNGQQQKIRFEGLSLLKEALQLDNLFSLSSSHLWTYNLRDFPFELNLCEGPQLRELFPEIRELIANFLWQAIYYNRLGQTMNYGTQIRDFWYNPLCAALFRSAFVTRRDKEAARLIYEEVLGKLIGDDRLFDYSDLGFEEETTHFRHYGSLPVVLMIEKEGLVKNVQGLLDLGICAVCTGGTPRLIASEFFAKGLLKVHTGPIQIIALVDYDPGGWWAARTLAKHLRLFGIDCTATPLYLVHPDRFTPQELGLFTLPLEEDDPRAEGWFRETNGIHGQRRIIHANWLRPAHRVRTALTELLKTTQFDNPP